MCCLNMIHYRGHYHGGFCGCNSAFPSAPRRVWSQREEIGYFEQYLEGLREEVKAVEERIAELKGKK